MSNKKVVLIIDNSVDTTGALKAILGFAQYAQKDYQFIFILPVGSKSVSKVRQSGFDTETLPFLEINKSIKSLLLYLPTLLINAWKIKRLAKKHQAVIIHINDFYNLVGVVAKIMGGDFALLTHVRFMPDRFPSLLVKFWYYANQLFACKIICVSQAVLKFLPVSKKNCVIYDTVPSNFESSVLNIETDSKNTHLLYLGHYIPGKGQNLALEAFHKAYCKNKNLHLRFVGGDMGLKKNHNYLQQLRRKALAMDIADVVTFDGPSYDVRKDILAADIILNFSESESFSMTCLETLMLRKPLIVTDCGGPAELFEHKISGWLVPNRNVDAMCEAILQLSEDRGIRQKFSTNSGIYVRSKFSMGNTYQILANLYGTLWSH